MSHFSKEQREELEILINGAPGEYVAAAVLIIGFVYLVGFYVHWSDYKNNLPNGIPPSPSGYFCESELRGVDYVFPIKQLACLGYI